MEDMSPDKIMEALLLLDGDIEEAIDNGIEAQIMPYQAAALFILAQQYNRMGWLLDIGTGAGYSASIMAQAAPKAGIVTLTPVEHEVKAARRNLKRWKNVQVTQSASWDYLDGYEGPRFNMIFVDGDHKQIIRDLPWFDWLAKDGLMLFHDYSKKSCPPVYEAVSGFKLDVLIVDDDGIGMAGIYGD